MSGEFASISTMCVKPGYIMKRSFWSVKLARARCSSGQSLYSFTSYLPGMDGASVWLAPVSISVVDKIGHDEPDPVGSSCFRCAVVETGEFESVGCVAVSEFDTDDFDMDKPSVDSDPCCDVDVVGVRAVCSEDAGVESSFALLDNPTLEVEREVNWSGC